MDIVRFIMVVFMVSAVIGYVQEFNDMRSSERILGTILKNITVSEDSNGDAVLQYRKKDTSVLCSYNVPKNKIIPSYEFTQLTPRLHELAMIDKFPLNAQVLAGLAGGSAGGLTLLTLSTDVMKWNRRASSNPLHTVAAIAGTITGVSFGYFLGKTVAGWTPPGADAKEIQKLLKDPKAWIDVGINYKNIMGSFIAFGCSKIDIENPQEKNAIYQFSLKLQTSNDTLRQEELTLGRTVIEAIAARSSTSFDGYVHAMERDSTIEDIFITICFCIPGMYIFVELIYWIRSKKEKPAKSPSTDPPTANID